MRASAGARAPRWGRGARCGAREHAAGSGFVHGIRADRRRVRQAASGTVESLLRPENKDKLAAILTYHVVSGKVTAADAVKLSEAKTVNGKERMLSAAGGSLSLNGKAKVVKADIVASNGVIHVIDAVVIPE